MVKVQQSWHPGVAITVHVDDFAIELEDTSPERLATRLSTAARSVRRAIETDLKGKLSDDKSALACSDAATERAVRRELCQELVGKPGRHASVRHLGGGRLPAWCAQTCGQEQPARAALAGPGCTQED